MPRLVFLEALHPERPYELVFEKTTVGRSEESALKIQDAAVSRIHCVILVWGTEVIVRDLGSRNGTAVKGKYLRAQQSPLWAGQVVQIGSVKARREFDPCTDSDTADSVTAVQASLRYLRHEVEPCAEATPLSVRLILTRCTHVNADELEMDS